MIGTGLLGNEALASQAKELPQKPQYNPSSSREIARLDQAIPLLQAFREGKSVDGRVRGTE